MSVKIQNQAAELARFVVENGRVEGSTEEERMQSFAGEVEFELGNKKKIVVTEPGAIVSL